MSLATDYLIDYLKRSDQTQADFAKSAGMTQPNINDILKGEVEISGRNLSKLLRGFREGHDQDAFLAAHLRDQVPAVQAAKVQVHIVRPKLEPGMVMEDGADETTGLEVELAGAFAALPSATYQRRVVRFLRHLRKDAELRDLFNRTMEYITEDTE